MVPSFKPTYEFPDLQPHDRLWNLVLFIAERSAKDRNFGKTKLAKILYFTDFQSFIDRGRPISGSAYRKRDFGPVPDSLFDLLDEMVTDKAISIERAPFYTYEQQRIVAHRQPDLTIFSGEDISLLTDVMADLSSMNATEVSNASHGLAWSTTPDGELIPYETAYLSDEPLTPDEITHLHELAERPGETR